MTSAREGSSATLRARVAQELDRLGPRLSALAADLHRQPELGGAELHTVARLAGELEEEGFNVEAGVAGLATAFRASKGSSGPGVAFLAEYDAVPGLGHACGHNLLCAASYGAAVALSRLEPPAPGRILVIGAPAEETIGGKVVLAARGAYEGVDVALLAHPGPENRTLVRSLASWSMDVIFEGRPAHAVAAPEQGVNALEALIHLFVARDELLRELRGEAFLPGVILEGGQRPNLVPARARARFSLRAKTAALLVDVVLPGFRGLAEGVARETGTQATIRPVDNLYDELVGNPVLAESYSRAAQDVGLTPDAGPDPIVGSLDVGALSQQIPVLHPLFRIAETSLATHTAAFDRAAASPAGVSAARKAALALAWTGLDVLMTPGLLERARAARAVRTDGGPRGLSAPLVTSQQEG